MKLNEIITLINAGYTKEEIQAFETEQPVSAPEPAAEVTQPADPEPVPAEPAAQPTEYQRLETLLKQFINTAQANNLNATMVNADPARSSNDILAEVISPKRGDKK